MSTRNEHVERPWWGVQFPARKVVQPGEHFQTHLDNLDMTDTQVKYVTAEANTILPSELPFDAEGIKDAVRNWDALSGTLE